MSRGDRKREPSDTWRRMQELITDDARYTVNLANDIVDQIYLALQEKNWTQKDLADALGKSPSEISKWLQPSHNFTCRTIGKLSAVFGKDLVLTPLRYDSMNGQLLPFGQQRNRAYVAARNARFEGVIKEQIPVENSTSDDNFGISEQTTIVNEETPASTESRCYTIEA